NPTLGSRPIAKRRHRYPARPNTSTPAIHQNGADQAPADALLRVENLHVVFDTVSGSGPAVDGVSFSLRPGERMGLIGESGCGKTTMATALLSLVRPPGRIESGEVWLGG